MQQALEAEVARIMGVFADAGAAPADTPALQPAEMMLDLYGEDMRARAFITEDPEMGELTLRPDFTAPVLRDHLAAGGGPARRAYAGPVFRRQAPGSGRPVEYMQAGIEIFGEPDLGAADAEVFGLIAEAVGPGPWRVVLGDLGVIGAAIDQLAAPPRWRAQLRRHIWRPNRFRALLADYAAPSRIAGRCGELLAAHGHGAVEAMSAAAGATLGPRRMEDIIARAARLEEDAATPAIPADQINALEAMLDVECPALEAPDRLRAVGGGAAVSRFEAVLARLGETTDLANAEFDASFGRTLEYYDGFVFELRAPDPDLPPLGAGGRYDALAARLGGRELSAVGGVVRPEALIEARAAC